MTREDRLKALNSALGQRILVLDGAMGTTIQSYHLEENDYRGTRFADFDHDVKGNNDLLTLTQPDIVKEISLAYLEAGADILTTNTFNSTIISQADYAMESLVDELNEEAARIAREAADEMTEKQPDKPRFVTGAIGPTNKTTSISPDVNDPGYRATSFDEIASSYKQAARGLIKGGADLILLETIFDTLNAKAGIFALEELFEELGTRLPVMISGTITDLSGRTLTGQTVEAFWYSVRHAKPFSIGLNCALGADAMRPHIAELSRIADVPVCAYPNAGLPNEFGEYDEAPETTAAMLKEWAESGLVNIVGGCCGTSPDHIRAIHDAVITEAPREIPKIQPRLRLSGLEPFEVRS